MTMNISSYLELVDPFISYNENMERGTTAKYVLGHWHPICEILIVLVLLAFTSQVSIFVLEPFFHWKGTQFSADFNQKNSFFLWFSSFGIGFWGWVTTISFFWPWFDSCFVWLTHAQYALSRTLWIEYSSSNGIE